MANGIAVGGFAQGLAQGLNQGFNLVTQADKNKREQEAFELDKKVKQSQIEEMERKKNFQAQVSQGMAEIDARLSGGTVGGVAVDEFGTELGPMQYSTPAQAKASGLSFKAGTAVEKEPEQLTQTQIDRMRADVFQKARIDNKLFDEESFMKYRQLNKEMRKEGVLEAFEIFDRTGDSDKAIDAFNKNGGQKLPKGSFIRRERDPETGFTTNVVYSPGEGGKPQRVTSSFDMQLLFMPEKMVEYGMQMSKSKFEQGQANKRTGMEVAGRIDAALIGATKDGKSGKDRIKERIDKYAVDFAGKLISNPSISYNVDEFRRNQPQIAARAYQYMTGRVPGQQVAYDDEALALDQATKDILGPGKASK